MSISVVLLVFTLPSGNKNSTVLWISFCCTAENLPQSTCWAIDMPQKLLQRLPVACLVCKCPCKLPIFYVSLITVVQYCFWRVLEVRCALPLSFQRWSRFLLSRASLFCTSGWVPRSPSQVSTSTATFYCFWLLFILIPFPLFCFFPYSSFSFFSLLLASLIFFFILS